MKNFLTVVAVCMVCMLLVVSDSLATDNNKNQKKNVAKRVVKKPAPQAQTAQDKAKQAEQAKKRAADQKAYQEKRAKVLAALKQKAAVEGKKREAEQALARRRARMPRLVSDLVDERQISQIEALQDRLNTALEARNAEQKIIFERSQEIRKEITALQEKFNEDVARTLKPDQQKVLAGRKAEIEKKKKAFLARRDAAQKAAQKKREANNKK